MIRSSIFFPMFPDTIRDASCRACNACLFSRQLMLLRRRRWFLKASFKETTYSSECRVSTVPIIGLFSTSGLSSFDVHPRMTIKCAHLGDQRRICCLWGTSHCTVQSHKRQRSFPKSQCYRYLKLERKVCSKNKDEVTTPHLLVWDLYLKDPHSEPWRMRIFTNSNE